MSTLKLQTIQHTNGTNSILINSSGISTRPFQPAFIVKNASNITGCTQRTVIFTEVVQNVGNGYNSSNGRFTAPAAGFYMLSYNLFTIGTACRRLSALVINGVQFTEITSESTNDAYSALTYSGVNYLNVNDYVEVSTVANLLGTGTLYSYFSGYFLG